MLRILNRLFFLRQKVYSWCQKYQRKNRKLHNVVNCRAYYILLNALDHQLYSQLALAFDIPQRSWNVEVFYFKIQQIWHGNAHNKFTMHPSVYAHVVQQLRFYENLYQPSAKEIKKFQRFCDERGFTCEFWWTRITKKLWQPEAWRYSLVTDTYSPPSRCHFNNLHSIHLLDPHKQLLIHFFLFDFEHYIVSHKNVTFLIDWVQGNRSLEQLSFLHPLFHNLVAENSSNLSDLVSAMNKMFLKKNGLQMYCNSK